MPCRASISTSCGTLSRWFSSVCCSKMRSSAKSLDFCPSCLGIDPPNRTQQGPLFYNRINPCVLSKLSRPAKGHPPSAACSDISPRPGEVARKCRKGNGWRREAVTERFTEPFCRTRRGAGWKGGTSLPVCPGRWPPARSASGTARRQTGRSPRSDSLCSRGRAPPTFYR